MDILDHLDNVGLSKYDMPVYFLQLDEIPLTAVGKIRKRNVVDWIGEGRAKPTAVRWQAKAGWSRTVAAVSSVSLANHAKN